MRTPLRGSLGTIALSLALAAQLAAQTRESAYVVRIDSNVAVPMRDGVILRADVYRPTTGGPFPTLVYRTPYGKHRSSSAAATARNAVQRGYAIVMQDVRGRYASEGEFLPYQQEGADGYDTIEWAARQPWSNGAVGTYGLSYPGAVQWLAAIQSPPSLKAMVPAMTFASPNQFWYSGGVWDNSWYAWVRANIARDRSARAGGDTSLKAVAPWLFQWRSHPPYDPWWSWAELGDKYARTSAAVLNFSGWHDEAYGPDGATKNYSGLVSARRGQPPRTALIMGPWTHGVPEANDTATGERIYGRAGVVDYDEIVLRWMDRYVRGIDNGVDREKPVRIFLLGANRWIEADGWPIPGARADTIVLRRPGSSTTIVSDPANPVRDEYAERYGAHDYRALARRGDVVVFETQAFAEDITVAGAMRAELFVSADAPDTDIWVKVHDVAPDGTAFNLMSSGLDVQRASYRSRKATRELLEPGRVYRIDLPDLFTANTFRRGHRIRVVVSTSFAPNFSHNLHTGELETGGTQTGRVARVTIHHDDRYPSRLILPVVTSY